MELEKMKIKEMKKEEKKLNEINLEDYGFTTDSMPRDVVGIPARITSVHKERYGLVCKHGETHGRLKTKEYYMGTEEFPTTGDFVLIQYISSGDSQIIRTLPRKTFFSRKDPTPGRGEQAVAANFDYVFIMQSCNHDFNPKRMERYLTLAWQSGAVPVVLLTKSDLLAQQPRKKEELILLAQTTAIGVNVHAISAVTGEGMEELASYLQPGNTIVFLGSSGVGKSSLVNALAQEEIMTVNEIREYDDKGHHTTTHRQLVMLHTGVMVIDTPGMRELGMWDVSDGLGEAFSDVEQFLGKCRFSDCKHQSEPGCAIKQAIDRGELSAGRWESYEKLKREAKYSDNKTAFLRQKQQRNKNLAQMNRRRKREETGHKRDL